MPINADEIEGLDDAIKAYLEQCVLNLDITNPYYGETTLDITVQIVAPPPLGSYYRNGNVLMEASETFEVGEKNEDD